MKNLVLIAPPLSGKGTIAQRLSKMLDIPHISSGQLLRDYLDNNDNVSKVIREYQEKGDLVPNSIVKKIIVDRLKKLDCNNGYILDGFPRTIDQVSIYDEILKILDKDMGIVVLIDTDKEELIRRIDGRIVCSSCGATYSTISNEFRPIKDNVCDKCSSSLAKRKDDTKEVFLNRYNSYMEDTIEVINYYEKQNKLYKIRTNNINDIIAEIIEIIRK